MTKRMLIDATHAEETRVVVLDGNRLEDFDVETSTKKQLKGNIYLAKVVRVEPSLQAAFVEYGGGRHGFLAFGEIHPDYYQIPVADRERLIRLQAEEARAEEAAEEAAEAAAAGGLPLAPESAAASLPAGPSFSDSALPDPAPESPGETVGGRSDGGVPEPQGPQDSLDLDVPVTPLPPPDGEVRMPDLPAEELPVEQGGLIDATLPDSGLPEEGPPGPAAPAEAVTAETSFADITPGDANLSDASFPEPSAATDTVGAEPGDDAPGGGGDRETDAGERGESDRIETVLANAPPPETVGGESEGGEEVRERRIPSRHLRNYKIQEVIRRRQILLVQVVKEERGTKGAALTTYISLAGRFSVLMPNSPRGGGISRKITSAADRRRLKEITAELEIPDGMGLIVRTAGANRPKPEIKRDCEYLLRLWDDIRETTMRSVAPALIHEEASLIKRAIRDVYSRDIDEILVDGEDGWKAARDVMRMLMPAHARKVISWRDHPASGGQPLFASQQVEAQLDAMMSPNVQLRSGGYLVINQTEALVAIDVNSGRSTRERGIEETALRTNLEAADEVARQLRLRDLAGLIVIDFIDMEAKKHNLMVERRLKEALRIDRARIQVGQISHFGLMEMSRQRLRPSLAENSFVVCPQCGGTGHMRSTESSAIHVLRGIDEEGAKRRAAEIMVTVAPSIAMYILNHKRDRLADIERRYAMQVLFSGDASLIPPQMRIDRLRAAAPPSVADAAPLPFLPPPPTEKVAEIEDDDIDADDIEAEEATPAEAPEQGAPASAGMPGGVPNGAPNGVIVSEEETEARRKRRRRRRRSTRRDDVAAPAALPGVAEIGAEQPDLLTAGPVEDTAIAPAIGIEPAEPALQVDPLPASDSAAPPLEVTVAPPPAEGDASEAAAADDEGAEGTPARRRGRRGGRRRRRDGTEDPVGAEAVAAAPHLQEPSYTGPTPANPFGGGPFDIFDVMEQAEQIRQPAAAIALPPPVADDPSPSAEAAEPTASVPPAVTAPTEPPSTEPPPTEPPPIEPPAVVEISPRGLHLVEPPVLAEEAPLPPPAEPLVKPVLIDSSAPLPERKRGWWRR